MKIGDLVMFNDVKSRYANWFFGKFAVVEEASPKSKTCRVRWLKPVKYYDRLATVSDFGWDNFEVYDEGR